MSGLQLFLVSKSSPNSFSDSRYEDLTSEELWSFVHNETGHLFMCESLLLELARRGDSHVVDFCNSLLLKSDIECWFLALRILATHGSTRAFEVLQSEYMKATPQNWNYVASFIAQVIDEERIAPFKMIAKDFASVGRLDVTHWTFHALKALESHCRRMGIEIISTNTHSGKHINPRTSAQEIAPLLFN